MSLETLRLGKRMAYFFAVLVAGLPRPAASEEFWLQLTSAVSEAGGEVDVYLVSTHARDLYAFQAAIALPEGLEVVAVDSEGCPAICGVNLTYSSQGETPGQPRCAAVGALLGFGSEDRRIPAGSEVRLAHLRLRVAADFSAGAIPLGFPEACGRVRTRLSARLEPSGAEDVVPALAAGEVRVEPGVRRPSDAPRFGFRGKICPFEDLSLSMWEDWPSGFDCEAEVRRVGAECPDVVLRLEQPVIPGSAFPEVGAYSIRFRWGNGAGFGGWSEPQRLEIIQCVPFLRSDTNGDGERNITDPIYTLNWLFLGGLEPGCLAAADSNRDYKTDLSDAVYTLNFLFLGGPAPPEPYPECGYPAAPAAEYQELGCKDPGSCR